LGTLSGQHPPALVRSTTSCWVDVPFALSAMPSIDRRCVSKPLPAIAIVAPPGALRSRKLLASTRWTY
jgi:hypothetical protein